MNRRRGKFWTLVFSFIPGAGQMYQGFFKMGLAHMSAFFLMIMVAVMLHTQELLYLLPIIWFYSCFHANWLCSLSDEAFEREEDRVPFCAEQTMDLFEKIKAAKIVAVCLIGFGSLLLFNNLIGFLMNYSNYLDIRFLSNFFRSIRTYLPQLAIGAAILWAGIKLLQGQKKPRSQEENGDDQADA